MPPQSGASSGFAARLRRLRLRVGRSQEALAEKAGISVTTVAAIEEGQRRGPFVPEPTWPMAWSAGGRASIEALVAAPG